MKITVTAGERKDNELSAQLTISKEDVNKAIKDTYRTIANRYNFKGFRRGHTPRPVIDSLIGRDAVLADATNQLLNDVEPQMLNELDIVPVEQVSFGKDPKIAKEGEEYDCAVAIPVRPEVELDSYDAPSIQMPPEEATEAEIDQQLDQLMSYHETVESIKEDRGVQKGDIIAADITDKENASDLAGKGKILNTDSSTYSSDFIDGLMGMKKGDTKDISWTTTEKKEDGDVVTKHTATVKLTDIREQVTPELTDEFSKKNFGFDTIKELRDAVKDDIESDKKTSLPSLKEDRLVEKLGERVKLDPIPENYVNQVLNEIAQQFLTQLQRQGLTLDIYLKARGISSDEFMKDLREQADERARQSLALDALAKHLNEDVTEDDIEDEFKRSGAQDIKAQIKTFTDNGQMPAIRESIRREKALKWMVDNAEVNIVDEIAEKDKKDADDSDKADD
ncbi:MAG: trigger factor, partial [Coriobacteriaceae bacterium]